VPVVRDPAAGVKGSDSGDELRLVLERSAVAPREARRVLTEWLRDVDCAEEMKADAVLVASELVTNAVVPAGSAPILTAMFDDGWLRLEIDDADRDPPQKRPPGERHGGYGLHVVERVTDAWGSHPTAQGKTVWTETLR
jgi:anti-sigma regulatory factor (Ser/Thr protein kinase)